MANDPPLDPGWRPLRGAAGSAGTVVEPIGAELLVAVPPLAGAAPGDAHRLGHVSDRAAGLDAPTQQQSTLRREWSVTVTHETSGVVSKPWTAAHLLPEVSLLVDPHVTNVHERNT